LGKSSFHLIKQKKIFTPSYLLATFNCINKQLLKMNDDIIETYFPGYTLANEETRHALWDEASADTLYQLNAEIQLRRGLGSDKLSMC
jgi:hypothetical protein